MKTIFKGLKEITFFVNNVVDASEYDKNIFGDPVFKSNDFVLYDIGFINIGLHQFDQKSLEGNTVPYFSVENIDGAIEYLLSSYNFEIYREKILGLDGSYVCRLISPYNNVIGLIQG